MGKSKITYNIDLNFRQKNLQEIGKQLRSVIDHLGTQEVKTSFKSDPSSLAKLQKDFGVFSKKVVKDFNGVTGKMHYNKLKHSLEDSNIDVRELSVGLKKAGVNGRGAFSDISRGMNSSHKTLTNFQKEIGKLQDTLFNTARWTISSTLINSLSGSFMKAVYFTADLDKSLNNIRIVTGQTAKQMDVFGESANRAAKRLHTTTLAYTEAALIFYQQGLGDESVKILTEATIKGAQIAGTTSAEMSELLTSTLNGYKLSAEEVYTVTDKLAKVGATTAADFGELATGLSKVASMGNAAGITLDRLTAQVATIVSTTKEAPESIGTSLKTIYGRMLAFTSNSSQLMLDSTGEIFSAPKVEKALAIFNKASDSSISLFTQMSDGTRVLRDMGDVVDDVGDAWEKTNNQEAKFGLTTALAGSRQQNRLIALFEGWTEYRRALEEAQNAEGTTNRQNLIYLDSYRGKLDKLRATTEGAYMEFIDADTMKMFVDGLIVGAAAAGKLIDLIGGLPTIVAMVLVIMQKIGNSRAFSQKSLISFQSALSKIEFDKLSAKVKAAGGSMDGTFNQTTTVLEKLRKSLSEPVYEKLSTHFSRLQESAGTLKLELLSLEQELINVDETEAQLGNEAIQEAKKTRRRSSLFSRLQAEKLSTGVTEEDISSNVAKTKSFLKDIRVDVNLLPGGEQFLVEAFSNVKDTEGAMKELKRGIASAGLVSEAYSEDFNRGSKEQRAAISKKIAMIKDEQVANKKSQGVIRDVADQSEKHTNKQRRLSAAMISTSYAFSMLGRESISAGDALKTLGGSVLTNVTQDLVYSGENFSKVFQNAKESAATSQKAMSGMGAGVAAVGKSMLKSVGPTLILNAAILAGTFAIKILMEKYRATHPTLKDLTEDLADVESRVSSLSGEIINLEKKDGLSSLEKSRLLILKEELSVQEQIMENNRKQLLIKDIEKGSGGATDETKDFMKQNEKDLKKAAKAIEEFKEVSIEAVQEIQKEYGNLEINDGILSAMSNGTGFRVEGSYGEEFKFDRYTEQQRRFADDLQKLREKQSKTDDLTAQEEIKRAAMLFTLAQGGVGDVLSVKSEQLNAIKEINAHLLETESQILEKERILSELEEFGLGSTKEYKQVFGDKEDLQKQSDEYSKLIIDGSEKISDQFNLSMKEVDEELGFSFNFEVFFNSEKKRLQEGIDAVSSKMSDFESAISEYEKEGLFSESTFKKMISVYGEDLGNSLIEGPTALFEKLKSLSKETSEAVGHSYNEMFLAQNATNVDFFRDSLRDNEDFLNKIVLLTGSTIEELEANVQDINFKSGDSSYETFLRDVLMPALVEKEEKRLADNNYGILDYAFGVSKKEFLDEAKEYAESVMASFGIGINLGISDLVGSVDGDWLTQLLEVDTGSEDVFKEAQSSLTRLRGAIDDFNSDGIIKPDVFASLLKEFPSLSEYKGDLNKLFGEAELVYSDHYEAIAQTYANMLMSEEVLTEDFYTDATRQYEDYFTKMLVGTTLEAENFKTLQELKKGALEEFYEIAKQQAYDLVVMGMIPYSQIDATIEDLVEDRSKNQLQGNVDAVVKLMSGIDFSRLKGLFDFGSSKESISGANKKYDTESQILNILQAQTEELKRQFDLIDEKSVSLRVQNLKDQQKLAHLSANYYREQLAKSIASIEQLKKNVDLSSIFNSDSNGLYAFIQDTEKVQKVLGSLSLGLGDGDAERMDDLISSLYDYVDGVTDAKDEWADLQDSIADAFQESTKAAEKSLKDALDFYKSQEESIESLIDATEKLIRTEKEQAKERLNDLKDEIKLQEVLRDYNNEVSDKNDLVSSLQQEYDLSLRDDSQEGVARSIGIYEELQAAREDLDETQHDQSIKNQEAALDEQIKQLDDYLSETGRVTADAMDRITADVSSGSGELMTELIGWNQLYGTSIDEDITSMWDAAKVALTSYRNDVRIALEEIANQSTSTQNQIDNLQDNPPTPSKTVNDYSREMLNNSEAWWAEHNKGDTSEASQDRKDYLAQRNQELSAEMEKDLGVALDYRNGTWYYAGLKTKFYEPPSYGDGGVSTEEHTALLHGTRNDPEWIFNNSQLKAVIADIVVQAKYSPSVGTDFTRNAPTSQINSYDFSNMITIQGSVAETEVEKLKKASREIADTVIDKINKSFRDNGNYSY